MRKLSVISMLLLNFYVINNCQAGVIHFDGIEFNYSEKYLKFLDVRDESDNRLNQVDTFQSETEKIIFEMINVERANASNLNNASPQTRLKPLKTDSGLNKIARKHSADMILRKFFDHVNPDRFNHHDRISFEHRRLLLFSTGENIWKQEELIPDSPKVLARKIMKNWMESPGHRVNILSEDYTHVGVGVAVKNGVVTATQDFAGVIAVLDEDVPLRLKKRSTLNFSLQWIEQSMGELRKYDFWSPALNHAVSRVYRLGRSRFNIEDGVYKIRFHVKSNHDDSFYILPGPPVLIE